MAINRSTFSSIISADEQKAIAKVIVCNTTMRGYLHLVTVRTVKAQDGSEKDTYQDILIHPDRVASLDIQKFDAVSVQGLSPRPAPGEARENTTYHWAAGARAIGRHLAERRVNQETNEDELWLTGVGVYAQMEAEQEAK